MVEWSIEAFRAAEGVRSIVVAVPPGLEEGVWEEQMLGGGGVDAMSGGAGAEEGGIDLVAGGATRAESVSHALEVVGTELVAIHDAARPLVTTELIEATIATLVADPDADGAIAATPVTDTVKRVRGRDDASPEGSGASDPTRAPLFSHEMNNGARVVETTLDRGRLWGAQTPQVFRAEALRAALAGAERGAEATDEAMLIEAVGGKVLIHPAPAENLKVTAPLDLRVAELLLGDR